MTLYEIVNLFMGQAAKMGVDLSREKAYIAVTHAMNAQLFNEDIIARKLEEYSPNLEYAVRREIKKSKPRATRIKLMKTSSITTSMPASLPRAGTPSDSQRPPSSGA